MSKLNLTVAKFNAWFNATSIKGLSILKRAAIEIASFVLASVAAYIIVVYSKAILIIFFELTSLLSYNGASNDAPALASSKPFEGARNIAFALTALVGGPFLVWRTILADKQTRTAEKQTAIAQEKTNIDEQTHFTTLYIKSIELLGATRLVKKKDDDGKVYDDTEAAMELRLGAIYALERIARDSWKDHWPIMEVLTAYIRESSPITEDVTLPDITVDIQAILTVIGRRNKKWIKRERAHGHRLNLTKSNLTQIEFSEGADFSFTDFSQSNIVFAEAIDVDFSHSKFDSAYLSAYELKCCDFKFSFIMRARAFDGIFINCNFYYTELPDTLFLDSSFKDCLLLINFRYPIRSKIKVTNCISYQKHIERFSDTNQMHLVMDYPISLEIAERIFLLIKKDFKEFPSRNYNYSVHVDWPALIEQAKKQS